MKKIFSIIAISIAFLQNFVMAQATILSEQLQSYSILSGASINSPMSVHVFGNVGAMGTISDVISTNDSVYTNNSQKVTESLIDLENTITQLNSLAATTITQLGGQTLSAGVYQINGDVSLSDTLALSGDSSSTYIFRISGSLSITDGGMLFFRNVKPQNIFWVVDDEIVVHRGVRFYGVVLSKGNISVIGNFSGLLSLLSLNGSIDLMYTGKSHFFYPCAINKFNYTINPPIPSILSACPTFLTSNLINGTDDDAGISISSDSIGNSYVTGVYGGNSSVPYPTVTIGTTTLQSKHYKDIFVAKYNSCSEFEWAAGVGGSSGDDMVNSISTDVNGNSYIIGSSGSSTLFFYDATGNNIISLNNTGKRIFVAKINSLGIWQWAVNVSQTGNPFMSFSDGNGIDVDNTSNVYVTGIIDENTFTFGSTSLTGNGGMDVFIAKLDANTGSWIWAKKAGGTGGDFGLSVTVDSQNNILVSGSFGGVAGFSPGVSANFGTINLASQGNGDIFVTKLNTSGNFLWAVRGGCTTITNGWVDNGLDINSGISTNGYVTGVTRGPATFGSYSVSGFGNAFVAKIDGSGNWMWTNQTTVGSSTSYAYSLSIDIDKNENSYITGSVNGSVNFGSTTLTTGIPFASIDSSGAWLWAISASSSSSSYASPGSTEINITPIPTPTLISTGYFWDNITLGSNTYNINLEDQGAFVTTICLTNFNVSITPNGPTSFCEGTGNLTLSAIATGGNQAYTYLWSTGATTSSITVNTAGTYSVTVSDACGEITTSQINVTTFPQPIANAGTDTTYCLGQPCPILNGSGGDTFVWSPTTGLSNPNIFNPEACPTTNTTYTLTITDNFGCSATDDITVTVDQNCASCAVACIPLAPSGILSSHPSAFQTYCINNDILVTGNVNLISSEFKIAPNVTITVDATAVLNIYGSHLYACDEMWKGIVVKPGGRVKVQSLTIFGINRSSLIEDAFIAIDIQSNSSIINNPLVIKDATFNRNNVGVQISDYSTSIGSTTYPMSITNTVFTSRDIPFTPNTLVWPHTNTIKATAPVSGLESPYINNTTFSATNTKAYLKPPFNPGVNKPVAGIILKNVGNTQTPLTPVYYEMTIGTVGAPKFNLFDNLSIGIDAISSNFTAVNNVFQNNPINQKMAVAINAEAKQLSVNRLRVIPATAANFTNRFYDVGRAINAIDYYEMIATNCKVQSSWVTTAPLNSPSNFNGKYGFITQTNRFRTVDFSDNKMYNIENGITFLGNFGSLPTGGTPVFGQYSGQINVNNNIIRPNLPGNPVTSQYVANAISVSNVLNAGSLIFAPVSGININNNTLIDVYRGIGVSSWSKKDIKVNENNITLVPDAFTNPPASANPLQYGIGFQVNNAATSFGNHIEKNTIVGFGTSPNNNVRAIVVALSINQQVRCNNVNKTYKGIEFQGNCLQTAFTKNTMQNHRYGFVLDNAGFIGTQGNSTTPTDNLWLGSWAAPDFKTATLATATASTAIGSELWVRNTSGIFNPNGSGFSATYPYPFGNEYFNDGNPLNSFNTIKYVTNNPVIEACNTISPCCPSTGRIARMEQVVQDQELLINNIAETRYINKNKVYRMLRAEPELLDSSTVLLDFYNERLLSNSETMTAVEDDFMQRDVVAGQTKAAGMNAENRIEQNYITFFESYAKQQNSTISTADSLNLVNMAMGCPFTDGEVVYQARALFNAIYMSNVIFDDNCVSENERKSFGLNEKVVNKTTENIEKSGEPYNLVPNYSFENYTACPSQGAGLIELASPWTGTNNSSDYVNACAPPCNLSVPCQSSTSYQPARTGNGIALMFMLNGYGGDYREYLQAPLLDTLSASTCYKVTFYTNQINSPLLYAVNNFGAYFSTNSFTTTWGPPGYIPQVLGFNNKIINDTVNWIEISGIYTANGGEGYITIGNFYDDAHTDTLNTGYGPFSASIYLFDDISLIPIDSIPGGMPAYAGADTNVIVGDSVFIGQKISNLNCNWYDEIGTLIANNTSGIYVSPTISTHYIVEQNLCGTITYDTVNVMVLPTSINELLNENNLRIYPNPSNGEFKLELNDKQLNDKLVEITISSLTGKVLYTKKGFIQENNTTFKVALSNGIYVVNVKASNGYQYNPQRITIIN
ncbi:MAG: DUF3494 domain-containing protein [Flavobacteriales bacterium]|nr:DUF3494 domain-containing protein [Flavobacteriales bacterium]